LKNRLFIVIVLLAVLALGVLGWVREGSLSLQRGIGSRASGNADDTLLDSIAVFETEDFFLTYDSTELNSALWTARSDETFLSWLWPEDTPRQKFETLVKWNDPGRVVWSKPRKITVDLLIEFAPEANHRVALMRMTCSNKTCRSTAQERGIPQAARLSVGDDGSAILVDDKALVTYDSVADLMSGAERKTERRSPASSDELVASAREAALVINRESLSGEIVEERLHAGITFSFGKPVQPAAVSINNGVQFVVDDKDRTELWDCPWSALKEDSECVVYKSPAEFKVPTSFEVAPMVIHDTECGLTISRSIWTWVVRRNARTEDVLVATGIVSCDIGALLTYIDRHIVDQSPKRQPVTSETRQLKVSLTPSYLIAK
jgi:hypothetical protein